MIKTFFLAIFALSFLAAATPAQMNPEQAILSARDQFSDIKKRSIELERMKRESYKRPVDNIYAPKFPAIKEDFEAIQKFNAAITKLTAQMPLNLAAVAKYANQVNHRAGRLKSNLFSAEAENAAKDNETGVAAPRELKKLFADLDKAVKRFVYSPIFQNLNVINSSDTLKAQKDLDNVIALSRAIKSQTKD